MPNIKSAIKRVKIAEIRRVKNAATKTKLRTAVKRYAEAVQAKSENAQVLLVKAVSNLDKAARKGVIHKNAASRKKSRLQKALNKSLQG